MHRFTTRFARAFLGFAVFACLQLAAHAEEFNWKKYQGTTLTFLANNTLLFNALLKHKADFEKQTGMTLKVDVYQEQQMRQRLVTVMNSRSDEIDIFASLPSREGLQFAKAGWYADLTDFVKTASAPDYDFGDFAPGLVKDATYNGRLMSIPLNVEGPLLYYRKDLFQKCGVVLPASLTELDSVAAKLKACEPSVTAFVSRGLKPALPYTFSGFLHNMGGQYMKDGKSQLCSKEGQAALALYSRLLKDYGPPGVVNYTFYQISDLFHEGRAAMAFATSNQLSGMAQGPARSKDTGIAVLPAGPGGSHPTVIGWTLAVSAHSKNKNAAWYFVQWATSKAVQETLALEAVAPTRAAIDHSPAYRAWLNEQPLRREWGAAVKELAKTGTAEVGYPIVANPASREFIGQAVDDLILGQKTVAQACSDADRQLNALIAKE